MRGKQLPVPLYFASLIYKNYIYIRNYLEGLVANGYSANDILLALDKRNVSPMGSKSISKNIKKHKNDVFRLAQLITADTRQIITAEIADDMRKFLFANRKRRYRFKVHRYKKRQ